MTINIGNGQLEDKRVSDQVNEPAHYKLFPDQQAIDIIKSSLTEAEFEGYCKGNALKYRLRAGFKNPQKLQEDIDKSNWYRSKLFEVVNAKD